MFVRILLSIMLATMVGAADPYFLLASSLVHNRLSALQAPRTNTQLVLRSNGTITPGIIITLLVLLQNPARSHSRLVFKNRYMDIFCLSHVVWCQTWWCHFWHHHPVKIHVWEKLFFVKYFTLLKCLSQKTHSLTSAKVWRLTSSDSTTAHRSAYLRLRKILKVNSAMVRCSKMTGVLFPYLSFCWADATAYTPPHHPLKWQSINSRIFLHESSWAAAWDAGCPPHTVRTTRGDNIYYT